MPGSLASVGRRVAGEERRVLSEGRHRYSRLKVEVHSLPLKYRKGSEGQVGDGFFFFFGVVLLRESSSRPTQYHVSLIN